MVRKPTGKQGPVKFTISDGNSSLEWETISYPSDKEKIEKIVLNSFIEAGKRYGMTIHEIRQNEENNFDFTLILPGGTVYMDLMEITMKSGSEPPFHSEQIEVSVGQLANSFLDGIKKKSKKYSSKSSIPIHLLTYSTHWRFLPSTKTINLVQYYLSNLDHVFENVFYLNQISEDYSDLNVLFPTNFDWSHFDPKEVEKEIFFNLNPAKFQIISN